MINLEDVKRLVVRKGEIVVFQLPKDTGPEQLYKISEYLRKNFPEIRPLLISDDVKIVVLPKVD